MVQNAEIIAIGSELLTPFKTDTNSLWLTEKLNEIGIDVRQKMVVGDNRNLLRCAISEAVERKGIIITTGGLGPTEDDLTREAIADALDLHLVFKEEILAELKEKFKKFGYEMPERNRSQAYLLEGAKALPNPNGSAVGMIIERPDSFLVVLPGPPRELKPMFENFVLANLKTKFGGNAVRRKTLRVVGLGESLLDEKIAPIYTKYENPQTAILFNKTEIEVHLTAQAPTAEQADVLNEELAAKIVEKLGINVISTDGETMEEIIARLLISRNEDLAVAESCTGGLIGMRLTEVSGASAYFKGDAISYANEAKAEMLGVAPELIAEKGAVSEEVAIAMAEGIRERLSTSFGISVTGIAGPDGGTNEKPVGTIWVGIADDRGSKAKKFMFPGDRYLIRWRSSQAALELLRRRLLHVEPE